MGSIVTHRYATLPVKKSTFDDIANRFRKLAREVDPSYWPEYTRGADTPEQEPTVIVLGPIGLVVDKTEEDPDKIAESVFRDLATYGQFATETGSAKHRFCEMLEGSTKLVTCTNAYTREHGACIRVRLKNTHIPYPVSWGDFMTQPESEDAKEERRLMRDPDFFKD